MFRRSRLFERQPSSTDALACSAARMARATNAERDARSTPASDRRTARNRGHHRNQREILCYMRRTCVFRRFFSKKGNVFRWLLTACNHRSRPCNGCHGCLKAALGAASACGHGAAQSRMARRAQSDEHVHDVAWITTSHGSYVGATWSATTSRSPPCWSPRRAARCI